MRTIAVSFLLSCTLVVSSHGQWASQTILLQPGWNAVYVEVQPEPRDCAAVFSGIPVESVWTWSRRFTSAQFVQDPSQMVPGSDEWLTWFPSNHPQTFLSTMHSIIGGEAYLIKLADGAAPTPWTAKGIPVVRQRAWYPDAFNLVGFPVGVDSTLTFGDYFAASPAHAGQPIYALDATGHWTCVTTPATSLIERGKAYWVRCSGVSSYAGPLGVTLEGKGGVEFGTLRSLFSVRVKNVTAGTRQCTVRLLPSGDPPSGVPPLGGGVPLSYAERATNGVTAHWRSFASLSTGVVAGGEWEIGLMARRADMQTAAGQPQSGETEFGSLLEITDGTGTRILVPVTAERGKGARMDSSRPLPRDGLWVGQVLLDHVSQAGSTNTVPGTPQPLRFILILHQASNGTTRLLQQVTVMQKRAATTNNVLITDPALVPDYTGGTSADDSVAGTRFSSVVFGFRTPQTLTYSPSSSTLSGTVGISYDDPLSPFKHLYHPDHNNLDSYTTPLPEGAQSFTVTRALAMTFATNPVPGTSQAGWNDTVAGGTYGETLQGLYHDPLIVAGTFVVTLVSDVAVLNDGR